MTSPDQWDKWDKKPKLLKDAIRAKWDKQAVERTELKLAGQDHETFVTNFNRRGLGASRPPTPPMSSEEALKRIRQLAFKGLLHDLDGLQRSLATHSIDAAEHIEAIRRAIILGMGFGKSPWRKPVIRDVTEAYLRGDAVL
jgi:hypothetical protein